MVTLVGDLIKGPIFVQILTIKKSKIIFFNIIFRPLKGFT